MEEQKQSQTAVQQSTLARFNKSIMDLKTQDYLQSVLGEKKNQFVNNITALVANDSKLQACTPMSIIYAGIKATALDLPLDPNLGFAYVIPYDNKKAGIKEAQFQIGCKGFMQLAIRSGQFLRINVTDVRNGEIKTRDRLTGDIVFDWTDDDTKRLGQPISGYLAYFRLVNGFEKMLYMSATELEVHAKTYSQTYKSEYKSIRDASKWTTDRDAMSKKTVLKLLLSKNAPLSVQMQDAIRSDQAVIGENGQPAAYIDNAVSVEAQEVYDDLVEEKKEAMRQAQAAGTTSAPVMP